MKAVRVERPGGREALIYTDVPDPTPEHGQVLVAIEFVGVNFIDIYVWQGLYPLPTPFTLGMEAAATVAQVVLGYLIFGSEIVAITGQSSRSQMLEAHADGLPHPRWLKAFS